MAALDVEMFLSSIGPKEKGLVEVKLCGYFTTDDCVELFTKIDGNDHIFVRIKELI